MNLKAMRQGGRILSQALKVGIDAVRPGVSLLEVEEKVDWFIAKSKAKASFKMVSGYRWATCINRNEGVVHGVPTKDKFKAGDLVSLDAGVYFGGYHTDMAYSFCLPSGEKKRDKEANRFLAAGKKALSRAVEAARPGNRIGDISQAIQETIEGAGFTCAQNLTGHRIGRKLHLDPYIPCVLRGDIQKTRRIEPKTALAIEVIYMRGGSELVTGSDNWTIKTKDARMAGLFEKTVYISDSKIEVLTPFFWENDTQRSG